MKYLLIILLLAGCMTEKKLSAYLQKNNYVKITAVLGWDVDRGIDPYQYNPVMNINPVLVFRDSAHLIFSDSTQIWNWGNSNPNMLLLDTMSRTMRKHLYDSTGGKVSDTIYILKQVKI